MISQTTVNSSVPGEDLDNNQDNYFISRPAFRRFIPRVMNTLIGPKLPYLTSKYCHLHILTLETDEE